jgi:lysozyme
MNTKILFDAIRSVKNSDLTQADVDLINKALVADIVTIEKKGFTLGEAGRDLIHSFESLKLTAYKDPGSKNGLPITNGWGTTVGENGQPIKLGEVWTKEMADRLWLRDAAYMVRCVNILIGNTPTTQNQFDALVSFAYNVGPDMDNDGKTEGLGDSTLMKKHRARDYVGAQAEFSKWNKNDGVVMKGLVRRRAAEAELYGRT